MRQLQLPLARPALPASGSHALGRPLLLLAVLLGAALLLIASTLYVAGLRQNELQREHEQRIVAANLGMVERTIADNIHDYAQWDDAVRGLVLDPDPDWAAQNVGFDLSKTFGYSSLVVGGDGAPTYGQVDGVEGAARAAAVFGPGLRQLVERVARQPGGEAVSGVLGGPGGLFVASAEAVRPEPDSDLSLPPGPPTVLVFAKHLGPGFLGGIAEDFGLRGLELVRPDPGPEARANVDLRGPDGSLLAYIAWQQRRPGQEQLAWLAPSLLGTLLAIGVFALLMIRAVRLAGAARESDSRFRSLVENLRGIAFCRGRAGDGPQGYDEQGAQVFGVEADHLIGTIDSGGRARLGAWYEAIHPDDRPAYLEADQARKRSGEPYAIDFRITHPGTGQVRWLREVAWVVDDPADGRYFDSYIIDVTEQRAREAALAEAGRRLEREAEERRRLAELAEEASRAKSEFLATMSHEIRTPMTGVLGMADLLASEELSERQQRYVTAIRNSGRHLLSVINDILDFSRIEAGRLELERIDFSLSGVLEGVRSLMMPQAVERGLSLAFKLDEGVPQVVRGDPTRLRQVLLNLVSNGLKFTAQGGVEVRITHEAVDAATRLRFEVKDTGIGISEAQQAGLFESFRQADQSTTRRYGGSGLGLTISKRIVEAMGGTIGVESTPGLGSRFSFEVPFEPGDATAVSERAGVDPAASPPLRLLVAEDVAVNRELLAARLGRYGHTVVFAVDGAEAVELAREGEWDAVLMDVQMPVMDGLEATRRIRRLPSPEGKVPILALTANVLEGEHRRCLAAGMDQVLTKPVVWGDLFAALAGLAAPDRRSRQPEPPPAAMTPAPVQEPAARTAPASPDESRRLEALYSYDILDTAPEETFDRIVRVAATILKVPVVLIGLMDKERHWFKAKLGLEASEAPRDQTFCAYTIMSDDVLEIEDATKDQRFAGNPFVADVPHYRFYAGAPLKVPGGHRLGTLCAFDMQPHHLDPEQQQALRDLAAIAADQLEVRRVGREAAAARLKAEAADQAKSDFLAAMSHEIRTPMTAMLGMADLLALESLNDKQRGYVEAVRGSGRHLLAIINDVLDFSRIEAGRLEIEHIDFSLATVLDEVATLMRPNAVERGLDLELALDGRAPPVVRGDPTRLKQILLNLVGNAIKFTAKGGVKVRVACVEGAATRLRFEVEDSGIGIDRARQAELFRPFVQADSSTTRRFGGSGLGLAICWRLVGIMGGQIGVESEPGRGSTFWLELPLEAGDAVVAAGRAELDPASLRALRILVAEDVPLNQDLLRDILERYGHAVSIAATGAEAVASAARQPFDLVLMDVQMPVMDGLEATRRIRQLPGPAGLLPIVALTANVTAQERRRCLEAGMNEVLTKPIAWGELFSTLRAVTLAEGEERAPVSPEIPAPETTMPTDSPSLLDRAIIAALGEGMEPDMLANFLGTALSEAEAAHATLAGPLPAKAEVMKLAHRLRGTAGMFGLARISELGGQIETAAGRDEDVGELITALGRAVADSRAEIGRLQLEA